MEDMEGFEARKTWITYTAGYMGRRAQGATFGYESSVVATNLNTTYD